MYYFLYSFFFFNVPQTSVNCYVQKWTRHTIRLSKRRQTCIKINAAWGRRRQVLIPTLLKSYRHVCCQIGICKFCVCLSNSSQLTISPQCFCLIHRQRFFNLCYKLGYVLRFVLYSRNHATPGKKIENQLLHTSTSTSSVANKAMEADADSRVICLC